MGDLRWKDYWGRGLMEDCSKFKQEYYIYDGRDFKDLGV